MPVVEGMPVPSDEPEAKQSRDGLPPQLSAQSTIRLVRLRAARSRHSHRHPFSEEIFYVLAGRGVLWEEGQTTPLDPGDVAYIPADAEHVVFAAENDDLELVCFFPHHDFDSNFITVTDRMATSPDKEGEDG